jgi:hypothetical protein
MEPSSARTDLTGAVKREDVPTSLECEAGRQRLRPGHDVDDDVGRAEHVDRCHEDPVAGADDDTPEPTTSCGPVRRVEEFEIGAVRIGAPAVRHSGPRCLDLEDVETVAAGGHHHLVTVAEARYWTKTDSMYEQSTVFGSPSRLSASTRCRVRSPDAPVAFPHSEQISFAISVVLQSVWLGDEILC